MSNQSKTLSIFCRIRKNLFIYKNIKRRTSQGSSTKHTLYRSALLYCALLLMVAFGSRVGHAEPSIVFVPYAPKDLTIAAPAHEGAHITLKGILRNADCGTYTVYWDENGDGAFNTNDHPIQVSPSGGTVYDIGRTFTVPNVDSDGEFPIDVRVYNHCTGVNTDSTYFLYVYNWSPSEDPRKWTKVQLEVMVQMGIQEALWYIHRHIYRSGSGSQISAYMNVNSGWHLEGSTTAAWAMNVNGRLPAYPPGTMNTYGMDIPADWLQKNDERWTNDPYAETALRLINYVVGHGFSTWSVGAAEEANTCGIQNGAEILCNPVSGTDDRIGFYLRSSRNCAYRNGLFTGGISTVLSGLAGTPAQVGNYAGTKYEVIVQQMVDYLGNMQIDSGGGHGGWDYWNTEGSKPKSVAYGSLSQWAYIGLESAEVAGKPFGIIVNNRHKYRIPNHLDANQGPRGGASYRSSDPGRGDWTDDNYHLTGGAIVANRWLEIEKLDRNSNNRPFNVGGNNYCNLTESQMVRNYEDYVGFIASNWTSNAREWLGSGRLWTGGSYTCGNTSSVYNWGSSAHCGNLYGIYSHQKGYRTGKDTLETIGGRDWAREFETTILRQQYRSIGDYNNFGLITDCPHESGVLCSYGGHNLTAGVGALILTPTIFNPKPIAKGQPEQIQVVEGCASATNGFVTFHHEESFHPNPNARIELYQWDVGEQDNVGVGRWWSDGGRQDFERAYTYQDTSGNVLEGRFAQFVYQYKYRGSYVAQLRVVESLEDPNNPGQRILGQDKTFDVQVEVAAAPNSPPSVDIGGPYVIERGENLRLVAAVSDRNLACGDTLNIGWEIHANQSAFNDLIGASGEINAAALTQFADGVPYNIRVRVTDSAGITVEDNTTFTIYPRDPVAVPRADANPIRCQQTVNFDGSQSFHPNPNHHIVRYEWDVDGRPGIDGGGPQPNFSYSYSRFGSYPVSLKVIDDHQASHTSTQLTIDVNQGNTTPVARIAQREYILLEGNSLVLSAAASYDNDLDCGDQIVSYEWDLNGDGQFNAADGDIVAGNPRASVSVLTLPWAESAVLLQWPANRQSYEPSNVITLRVTDTFGASATVSTKVIIFRSEPEAYFDQRPDPAPIDEELGRVRVTLDARESYSPIPGGQIIRYEWDLDADGQFDDSQLPEVDFLRIFNDLDPAQLPSPLVRLRVTDHLGQKSTFERRINYGLGDVPPTADADPSDAPEIGYHILEGDPLILSAAQTIEPNDGDYVKHYRWKLGYQHDRDDPRGLNWVGEWDIEEVDLDRDGAEAVVEISHATLTQMGYGDLGVYGLLLEVEDDTLLTARDTSSFTLHPRDPVAAAVIDPPNSACGQRVTLDASASGHSHPGINIIEWAWDMNGDGDFDDPEDARGERSTYVADEYTFNGPVNVTLRVTDDRGGQSTAQATFAVDQANSAPTPNAGGPYVIAKNHGNAIGFNHPDQQMTFDASDSMDSNETCGDQITRYAWDLGEDGSIDSEAPVFTLTREELFNKLGLPIEGIIGRYWASLTVWDRFNASSTIRIPIDVVVGPTAIARVIPDRFGCEDAVLFDGSASTTDGPIDQGFALVEYSWDFDLDGIIDAQGESIERNYANEAGQYFAGLIVMDASDRVSLGLAAYELVIDDLPPIADAGGPYVTGKDRQDQWIGINLDARASRDPNEPCDQIVHYLWDTDRDGLYGRYDTNGAPGRAGSDYEGELIRNYINPSWRVGSVQLISLIACDDDQAQHCSTQPAQVRVEVTDNAPPSGEIISPRSGDCLSDTNVPLRLNVKDPDGELVNIKVYIDGGLLTETNVQTTQGQANGEDVTINLNSNLFAEGARSITVTFTDEGGSTVTANAGGPVTFDRTPPELAISANLLEDACYRPAEVPDYTFIVEDNIDPSPVLNQRTDVNVCEQYLIVTATDKCGNSTETQRRYRVAQPIQIQLEGPTDGELVSPAESAFSWTFGAPVYERCANQVTATLSREGQQPWVYISGTQTDEVGIYTFTINVPTCAGDDQIQRRSFKVNGPPIARPVSLGHPNADNLAQTPTYTTEEGLALRLEADDSLPPEVQDSILHYRWDLDGDGVFEREGAQINFDTSDDGLTIGLLEVEDSFGLTHQQEFEIFVQDVDPIVDAGGPYNGIQGQPLLFDARQSREANPADPLSSITWLWGDGRELIDNSGPFGDHALKAHTFDEHGNFEVTVLVADEDSTSRERILVNIRDVHPQIIDVEKPIDAYALQDLEFRVIARSGAPADELISFDFDFLGDGHLLEFSVEEPVVYQYLEAGDYQVYLRVRDPDSKSELTFPFSVRPVQITDILLEINSLVDQFVAAVDAGEIIVDPRALASLSPVGQPSIADWMNQAIWAETQRSALMNQPRPEGEEALRARSRQESLYRGNTLMALDELTFRLNRAQERGARWGTLLWKISRQLLRETEAFRDRLIADDPSVDGLETFERGETRLAEARQLFEGIDYKDRVIDRDGFLARDLFALIYDAHFALRHAQDLSTIYDGFPIPQGGDVINRLTRANDPNGQVNEALAQLESELRAYLLAAGLDEAGGGVAHPDAPGIVAIQNALTALAPIQEGMSQRIGLCTDVAEGEECPFLGERESLELQLNMMNLVTQLFSASDQGVYVRNAQKMLTLAVRFRVEVDLIRVEQNCGIFSPYPLAARAQQEVMNQLLDQGQDDAALLFYISPERRCLAIEQFNECVVPAVNRGIDDPAERLASYEYPELCDQIGAIDNEGEQVAALPPIPSRPLLRDINILFTIMFALNNRWDLSNPVIRAQRAPEYTWEQLNRDFRDQAFDLNDYFYGVLQFNHDPYDYDQDGLPGSVEIDCDLINGVKLSVFNAETFGEPDGEVDCDGDGIPNRAEIEMILNPNVPNDAALDLDSDGMSNYQEWYWNREGLPLDPRDPTDARGDADGDEIINTLEIQAEMNPLDPNDAEGDFDQDGLNNRVEVNNGLDPRDPADPELDPDGDGLTSREEIARGRDPLVADCVDDPVELVERDDQALMARILTPDLINNPDLNLTEPMRVIFDQGVICNTLGRPDLDWYRFKLPRQGVRVVARLISDDSSLSLRMYDDQQGVISLSSTNNLTELIATPRGQLPIGEYLLRVDRDEENAATVNYQLELTLLPPVAPCLPDVYEGEQDNNQFNRASPLAPEGIREGALWICETERQRGDWFAIPVSDQDLTVHIGFLPNSDGLLGLSALTQEFDYVESVEVNKTGQCLNIKAPQGGGAEVVYLNVTASTLIADGDQRVDYTLQVQTTDLAAQPRGECDRLNQGLYLDHPWPTLDLGL